MDNEKDIHNLGQRDNGNSTESWRQEPAVEIMSYHLHGYFKLLCSIQQLSVLVVEEVTNKGRHR